MTREEEEKKNRRLGLWMASIIHAVLIVLALLPFLSIDLTLSELPNDSVEVMIFDFSRREGASAKARPRDRRETSKRSPAPAPAEVFRVEPLPVPEVVASDLPEKIRLPEPSMPKVEEVPEAESAVVDAAKAAEPSPATAAEAPSDVLSGDNQQGSAATAGQSDAVEGEGKGSRYDGLDLSGNGVLTRKVISRASLEDIIGESGTFVINICVNQRGIVVGAKFNEELSTVQDKEMVRKAIAAALKYRFEADYSAPAKQCGKMTFKVERFDKKKAS